MDNAIEKRAMDLCRYRLDKARICLKSAKTLIESNDYCGAANRSYYAIFHCIRSLLALDGTDFSKHSGVMSYFQRNYVKTGIFSKEYSKILTEAFEIRSESDYDDYYIISKDEVEEQLKNAAYFFNGISNHIDNIIM